MVKLGSVLLTLTQIEAMHVGSKLPTSLTSTISGVDFELRNIVAASDESQLGLGHRLSVETSAKVTHPVVLDAHKTADFS